MDASIVELLKQASKDEESFAKLSNLFENLSNKVSNTQQQLDLLESAINEDYDSICITELDLDLPGPRIVYVNSGFEKMTGYSRDEAIGNTPRMLQGPKTDRAVLDRLRERLIDGQCFFGHTVNYRKDGKEFINQWDIHPLTNAEGEITHWVSYQRDISENNKAEKVIFDANVDADDLREESRRTYLDLDMQGSILASNKAFREMTGYEVDELKPIKVWDLIEDGQKESARELFENLSSDNVPRNKHNWTFITKESKMLNIETTMKWFVNNDQDVFRVYMENLTMRNRILNALHLDNNGLGNLLSKKDEFTLKYQKNNGSISLSHVSESFNTITGHDSDSIVGTLGLDLVHEEDKEQVSKHIEKAFEGRCSTYKCRYKNASGDTLNIIQHFNPDGSIDEQEIDTVKVTAIVELELND